MDFISSGVLDIFAVPSSKQSAHHPDIRLSGYQAFSSARKSNIHQKVTNIHPEVAYEEVMVSTDEGKSKLGDFFWFDYKIFPGSTARRGDFF